MNLIPIMLVNPILTNPELVNKSLWGGQILMHWIGEQSLWGGRLLGATCDSNTYVLKCMQLSVSKHAILGVPNCEYHQLILIYKSRKDHEKKICVNLHHYPIYYRVKTQSRERRIISNKYHDAEGQPLRCKTHHLENISRCWSTNAKLTGPCNPPLRDLRPYSLHKALHAASAINSSDGWRQP